MAGFEFETIFTLEARSNIALPAIAQRFGLSDSHIFNVIRTDFRVTLEILSSKNVRYAELRRALVPAADYHERALVFDYTKFDAMLYGREVIHALLPHLRPEASHSVLAGAWLDRGRHAFADWLELSPQAHGTIRRERIPTRYSTLYFIYLNGLSGSDVIQLDRVFHSHPAFVGTLDMDRNSPLKTYLSTCLIRDFIKHKRIVVKGHEDDRDHSEDYNLSLFEFEKFGLTVRSVPLTLYGLFLSYKIEALMPLSDGADRRFALNSLTDVPKPLDAFRVVLDDRKWQYLRERKAGSLKRMGFAELSADEVCAKIKAHVDSGYIYELARTAQGEAVKFNVLLESESGNKARCVLRYAVAVQELQVVTIF